MEDPKLIKVKNSLRVALLAGTVISGLAFAAPVVAQEAPQKAETVVVTGSRLLKRDNVAESPIFTVGAEKLAETGYVATEQFLNTLPQIAPGLSSQSNNPSSNGRATLDLRGLGQSRNLVLINGRRGQGSYSGGTVDINTIPSALIERAEIITGGAATAYGADAVAGVVNFILKKNFEGVQFDTQYGITELGDGKQSTTSLTMGSNFADGRGNAVFSGSFYKRDPIGKGARSFAAQASSATGTFPGGGLSFGADTPTQAAVDALFGPGKCDANGGQAGFGFNPNGSLFCTGVAGNSKDIVGYTGPDSDIAKAFAPDFFSYNFEPDNLLVLPLERWNVYTAMNYDVNRYFKPYTQFMYTNYNAVSALAPTPAAGTTGFTVPVTNPFLSAQAKALAATRLNPTAPISMSKRFNALGPRKSDNNFDVWQLTLGTKGDFGSALEGWTYDAYWSYGRTILSEIQDGNVRRDRVQSALNAADGGASLCTGGLNLFGTAPISESCRQYISLQAKNLTTIVQKNAEATINGNLFKLPAGDVQTVFGVAWRDLSFDFKPDGGLQPGLVAGFNEQKPVNGYLSFLDFFTEASVPLLKDLPLMQELTLNLGARTSKSNVSGDANSLKGNLEWRIVDSLRFRGGYQTAVRAPNVSELYAPQLNNFPTFTNQDPCNTTGTIAATYRNGANGTQVRALCTAQSAVAGGVAYVQPFGQATGITGGNPDLGPEKAESYNLGIVYRPAWEMSWLDRFNMTVDYWAINVEEAIGSVAATTIVQRCYNRDNANPTYDINNKWCQLFTREASNGGVINLKQLQLNQAFQNTSGVDLTFNWGMNLADTLGIKDGGRLDFNVLGTWVEKFEDQSTNVDPVNDWAGTIGSTTASAFPEWRWSLSANYSVSDFRIGLSSRYIGEMVHVNTITGGSPLTNTGTAATWYHDLATSYDWNDAVSFRFGVNNLLDQEPRIYNPNVQANTDPSMFDVLGRRYYAGVKVKF